MAPAQASISPSSLGVAVIAVAWVLAVLATVIVAIRFYVRLGIVKRLFIDDYIILITLLLALGNSAFVTVSASWGLGYHIDALASNPARITNTIKWMFLCENFAIMAPGFGRISFAFLLLNLLPPSGPRSVRPKILWTIIATQFVIDVGTVIISMTQCRPIAGFWDRTIAAGCWDPRVQQYTGFFQGSVCSIVDLTLALFPANLFWNANMQWKQKLTLSTIMGLGIFSMVASIMRTIQLQAITQTQDATFAMAEPAIFWTLEAYFVLIAVSIPTLRPIFKSKKSITPGGTFAPMTTRNEYGNGVMTKSLRQDPFEKIWEPTPFKYEIGGSQEEEGGGSNVYKLGSVSQGWPRTAEHQIPDSRIRKDTIFSVTLDCQEPGTHDNPKGYL